MTAAPQSFQQINALPVAYCGWHPDYGWRPDLAAKDAQIATAVVMRSISGAAQQGWSIKPLYAASGDVRAAVIEPTDGHGHTGEFTATEFNERAWDHEKAAKNGLSAGPNVSYVRTFQACAVALRYAAKHMFSQSPATEVTADDLKHHTRFLLDRLQEFDPGDFEAEREFHGHVAPAIARLRNALGVA